MEESIEKLNSLVSNSILVSVLERKNQLLSCKLGQSESYIQELESVLEIKGPNELDLVINSKENSKTYVKLLEKELNEEKKKVDNLKKSSSHLIKEVNILTNQKNELISKINKYEKILKENNLI